MSHFSNYPLMCAHQNVHNPMIASSEREVRVKKVSNILEQCMYQYISTRFTIFLKTTNPMQIHGNLFKLIQVIKRIKMYRNYSNQSKSMSWLLKTFKRFQNLYERIYAHQRHQDYSTQLKQVSTPIYTQIHIFYQIIARPY